MAFSMDGRGRFLDNIFIERLWRSLKYEAVYPHELRDGLDACRIIGSWIDFYNEVCPHSALNGFALGPSNKVGPPHSCLSCLARRWQRGVPRFQGG